MTRQSVILGLDGKSLAVGGQPYEGATRTPRGHGWQAPAIGPNRALAAAGPVLRNRSRQAHRNSPYLRSAIEKGVTAEVGKGVVLISTCKDPDVKEALDALWKQHQHCLDPWGDMTFGAILQQLSRARKTGGEVFIRRIPTTIKAGPRVPFELEILEAEFCPMELNKRLAGNRRIVQGVELLGRKKVAFWFHKQHPTDLDWGTVTINDLVRVPARDVIHHYQATRPGQIRGEPGTSAALLKDREFTEYSDAELVRKKTRSAFTGFLYRENFAEDDMEFDPQTGKPLYEDVAAPEQSQEVAVGTILRGMAGEKLQLFEGDSTGAGYADFIKSQMQQLAAALDIPYPVLTGDWSGLSDRTIRAILNEYRRGVASDQLNLLGFQVCLGVWRWFVDSCVLMGHISAPDFADNPWAYYALDIRPDAWRHLHPEQDIRSRDMAIKSLYSNPEREAADCGADLDENMAATARTIKKWRNICAENDLNPDNLPMFGGSTGDKETEE
ncbi:phage portal protein [Aeromonas aquatica]|uniref:phage portal protein n=1 Tax=Aeromonas aquatica TaxID=558964 RepID=UPI00051C3C7B|nr:phage portal protein [Aeromonas aquatica]